MCIARYLDRTRKNPRERSLESLEQKINVIYHVLPWRSAHRAEAQPILAAGYNAGTLQPWCEDRFKTFLRSLFGADEESLMAEFLFWLYLINAVLLINHEIDSAYWKEWELFGLPGGEAGFLLMHFPLLLFILYGLVLVSRASVAGLVFSLILSFGGLFAFGIHTHFLVKERPEFDTAISKLILLSILNVSIVQLVVTLYLMVTH
ncbi:MAG: hypothetical protein HY788_10045 [Deltaproteobacteria bacterium]|nr:hypothetical protein [Deltaproteobacteria bacterium]